MLYGLLDLPQYGAGLMILIYADAEEDILF